MQKTSSYNSYNCPKSEGSIVCEPLEFVYVDPNTNTEMQAYYLTHLETPVCLPQSLNAILRILKLVSCKASCFFVQDFSSQSNTMNFETELEVS